MAEAFSTKPIDYDEWYTKVYGPGNTDMITTTGIKSQGMTVSNKTSPFHVDTRRLVQDDELLIFNDGFQITGKELGTLLKIAKKLGMKEYPEDFV